MKYNFPKFKFPIVLTTTCLVNQLKEWNDKYKKVTDLAIESACHFNRLIILLLDNIPKLSPIIRSKDYQSKDQFCSIHTRDLT